jgi:predicted HicB family RNase H-like nuclease
MTTKPARNNYADTIEDDSAESRQAYSIRLRPTSYAVVRRAARADGISIGKAIENCIESHLQRKSGSAA